jgi:uncharacterized protein (TIGR00297 family)
VLHSLPARAAAGVVLALVIALAARRVRALSRSGVAAAVVTGALCTAAGWGWAALLVAFFASSTLLSRWRAAIKTERTRGIVAKGGERDATQVLANGGPFAAAALLSLVAPWAGWEVFGAGALAAAAADTWGTEIGTLAGGMPRALLSGRRVPPGTSGGITAAGTIASLAGATFLAVMAMAALPGANLALPVAAGGFGGAMMDSLLGATAQSRRRCDRCDSWTEQMIHECGTPTRHAAGLARLDNDAVNLASGIAGGLLAVAAWSLLRGSP